ncbi:hypothetical protein K6119_07610 [Paracrocinitomix mangrovi]|uniref:hypothetical protein n=1 Tax=Paracrocinitomix mangrovi TaxID=2862509 RepID=UPI001C8E6708|nr:hypothetical protein [Paracrocinitomix mangrovi]UKN03381.1 hypothetical protein K6119_07610 [Paracrocinitomix mangrovi]
MFKTLFISTFVLFLPQLMLGQCDLKVTHLKGTQTIGHTTVKVSSDGMVDQNSDYCDLTSPYFIGYNYATTQSGDGYYEFSFEPAIQKASLNFSGTSATTGGEEEISVWVNGDHYKFSKKGSLMDCNPEAIITKNGNLGACENCSVAGWKDVTIEGPIQTLRIKDTLISGMAAGSIFSLFICESPIIDLGKDTTICTGEQLILNASFSGAKYKWQDGSTKESFTVTKSGIYSVKVTTKFGVIEDQISVVVEDCVDLDAIPRAEHWKYHGRFNAKP